MGDVKQLILFMGPKLTQKSEFGTFPMNTLFQTRRNVMAVCILYSMTTLPITVSYKVSLCAFNIMLLIPNCDIP